MEENVIVVKSKAFALRIIRLYQNLQKEHEFTLSKQMLRSGTSVGANVKEAIRAYSRADFFSKMNIALKEASEMEYWLELLNRTGYIPEDQYKPLQNDCGAIRRMLIASINTTKAKQ